MNAHNTRQAIQPRQNKNKNKNIKPKINVGEYGSNLNWKSSKYVKERIDEGVALMVVTDLTETGCRKDIGQCWCVKVDPNGKVVPYVCGIIRHIY